MSARDFGLVPVKVNSFVHRVAKLQHDYLAETREIESSLVEETSALIAEYASVPPGIFRQLIVPRIHSWGGPWKWLYIRDSARPALDSLVGTLSESLSERYLQRLPQGINSSNLLSAAILARAVSQKLIFKANHVESNHGYRFAVRGSQFSVPKVAG